MTDTLRSGGVVGDPVAAQSVAGTGSCCGSPSQDTPDPAATAGPCCGTAAEARADGACCGAAARSDAVATGAGCCG